MKKTNTGSTSSAIPGNTGSIQWKYQVQKTTVTSAQEQKECDVTRTNGNHNEQENEEVYYPSIALSAPDHHSL